MADQIILSDPISTLVTKTNTLIGEVGDKANLTTDVTTNLVAAINSVRDQILDVDDSSDVIGIINTEYALTTPTTINNIISDSATITSLAVTTLNVQSNALDNVKAFTIKNSSGTNLLAGYLLSTSSVAGTL
jgi:hypothetical protein|tara:strand:- start:33 stop:428 length:396 start_codon:yes stop_codon:yes gene_type:complete